MENSIPRPKTKNVDKSKFLKFDISKSGEIVSLILALSIGFSILRNYIYYVLLLHVPIFQYLEVSDIILLTSSLVWVGIYTILINFFYYLINLFRDKIWPSWGITTVIFLIFGFICLIFILAKNNDPAFSQLYGALIYHKILFIPFVIFVGVTVVITDRIIDFYKKYPYIRVLLIVTWFSIAEAFASYSVLIDPSIHLHIVIQEKGKKKQTILNDQLILAGRTNNYWFLYTKDTKFVRVLKNDDIESVDYDTVTK